MHSEFAGKSPEKKFFGSEELSASLRHPIFSLFWHAFNFPHAKKKKSSEWVSASSVEELVAARAANLNQSLPFFLVQTSFVRHANFVRKAEKEIYTNRPLRPPATETTDNNQCLKYLWLWGCITSKDYYAEKTRNKSPLIGSVRTDRRTIDQLKNVFSRRLQIPIEKSDTIYFLFFASS